MCAIAGIMDLPYDDNIIHSMITTMRRRGPDGKGIYTTPACCMLHTRLSIVDPSGGHQPMVLDQGRNRYTISYNGELYNTEELRQELKDLGHLFDGYSDTEVVLHAYAQWKELALEKMNGIFAFAVLEEPSGRLFLARDRIGVKPLFYKIHQGGLLFASEMKTILAYPNVKAELDGEGVAQLLMLGPGRIPGSGVLRDLQEIEPGCCGIYEDNKLTIRRYWMLKDRIHKDGFEETAVRVRELVLDSIRRQMVADVPIGTFLSGGLDSSLISSVCARELDQQGKILDTFSLDFQNNDRYFQPGKFQPNADGDYIKIMQSYLDNHHHWTVLSAEELVNAMEESVIARDLPGMADVDSSLLIFCGQIRPFVKVALSGECADEIFGGYPWFRDADIRDQAGFPWAQNTSRRVEILHPWVKNSVSPEDFVNDLYVDSLHKCDILPENTPQEKRMKEMVNLNFRWFMQTLLDRKDRMSMYQGLEVRVPFCDYRIAEYMYAVPWEFKDHRGYEKGLLRYAMRGILPEEVLFRKKSPYPKTYDPQYLQMVLRLFREMMDDTQAPIFNLVERSSLEKIPQQDFSWPWYGQLMQLPQTLVYMLQINFWMKHYSVQIR